MGECRTGDLVIAVDDSNPGIAYVVFPIGSPVQCGISPGERNVIANWRHSPRLTVVVEIGELWQAAVAVALSLAALHALRFVLDAAAVDDALCALGLTTWRRRDIAVCVGLGHRQREEKARG